MKITIEGTQKEIADLILRLQSQLNQNTDVDKVIETIEKKIECEVERSILQSLISHIPVKL